MKTISTLALLSLLAQPAAADGTATLAVTVLGVSDAGGQIKIGVYDEAGFKARSAVPLAGKSVLARPGKMVVTIDGIAPGTYGVKMFQDVNRNGHFDFGAMLTEPFGISNDPEIATGLPDFSDAKIMLVPGENAVTITLH